MTKTDAELLGQIRDTFGQLAAWGARVRDPFIPDPGSPLAADEAVFKWLSTSEIAWQGLCAAQDHLKGFRIWLMANPTDLFPMATFSLLRGALVGGALAAWVLAPDEQEARLGRSLAAAADWYRNYLNYGKTVATLALNPDQFAADVKHVEDRANRVRTLRVGLAPGGRLNMTNVIDEVTREVWTYDDARAIHTKMIWQAGSGDAHAFGWQVVTRGHSVTPLSDGMGAFVGRPALLEVANAYMCAYDFVAFGFHRLDELGSSTPSHTQ